MAAPSDGKVGRPMIVGGAGGVRVGAGLGGGVSSRVRRAETECVGGGRQSDAPAMSVRDTPVGTPESTADAIAAWVRGLLGGC